jgi:hypothetical protein
VGDDGLYGDSAPIAACPLIVTEDGYQSSKATAGPLTV